MPALLERRVDRLEDLMAQLLQTTAQTSRELREFKEEMRLASARADARLAAHIGHSRQEMSEFKQEMREFKDEMLEFKQEMREFKDEMLEFKDEMLEFKDEMRHFKSDVDRKFGEVSRDIGRLVENIIAPGIPEIFQEVTGLHEDDIEFSAIRVKKKKPGAREFDAVIVGGGYVLINETKATLRPEYVREFHKLMESKIHRYFPEYAAQKFLGIVSSLYVDDSIIALGARLGLFVLGFGNDLLDVLNPPSFTPRYF